MVPIYIINKLICSNNDAHIKIYIQYVFQRIVLYELSGTILCLFGALNARQGALQLFSIGLYINKP